MKSLKKKTSLFILGAIIIAVFSAFIYEKGFGIPHDQLTSKQKIEDFDYLYNILKDNYPYFEVNKRIYGVDWLSKKQQYEKEVSETRNDKSFVKTLSVILGDLHSGHTDVVDENFYKIMAKSFSSEEIIKGSEPWAKVINDPKVMKRYEYDGNAKNLKEEEYTLSKNKPCYETHIIIPNKVAYISISVFDGSRTEADKQGIYRFLSSVRDYPKLIIDIRGNGGGSEGYWINNIVVPLISNQLSARYYMLFRGGEYEMPFLNSRQIGLSKMSNLDSNVINKFPPEADQFEYYCTVDETIAPCNSLNYKGKIYLLVDKHVFSSSEAFASFSKATGFAKLIGERTGGDGIGIDPIIFSLPNSGIVVRFPAEMGLNPDGSSNAEKRTAPDISVNATPMANYEFDKAVQAVIKD